MVVKAIVVCKICRHRKGRTSSSLVSATIAHKFGFLVGCKSLIEFFSSGICFFHFWHGCCIILDITNKQNHYEKEQACQISRPQPR